MYYNIIHVYEHCIYAGTQGQVYTYIVLHYMYIITDLQSYKETDDTLTVYIRYVRLQPRLYYIQ